MLEHIEENTRVKLISDIKHWAIDNEWCPRIIIGVAMRTYGIKLNRKLIERVLKNG